MKKSHLLRGVCVVLAITAVAACQGTDDTVGELQDRSGVDIQAYLDALPSAHVLNVDFGIPSFVEGNLAKVEIAGNLADTDMTVALEAIAPVFRASPADLVLHAATTDMVGDQHFRYRQVLNGRDVIGGEMIFHVRDGVVFAANGTARSDLEVAVQPAIEASEAIDLAREATVSVGGVGIKGEPTVAYRLSGDRIDLVYRVDVTGEDENGTPIWDTVLVNAIDGSIVDRMPHIHSGLNRAIYSANNGTSTPGTLKRSEGGAATGDSTVDGNYDLLGWTYNCYKNLFGRDSYNNAGAQLKSTVHYSSGYCNAYWNSVQMVYGDGNGTSCKNLATEIDVTAHELTHAVTEYESNLTYSGESGGLNESMSDIFGAVCELYKAGGNSSATTLTATPSTATTWKVGENVLPPALRYMYDPAADGASLDFWTSGAGSVDVHYSSGISNLAFYLLSQGGTHPRGKSSNNVPAIGINKASQIWYLSNTNYMTASTNYAGAKTATESAASALYGSASAEKSAVTSAWQAVGVGGGGGGGGTTVLTKGVPVTGISGAASSEKNYSLAVASGSSNLSFAMSGGSGDADMYVKFGSPPTTTSYDCRPYTSGNNETCNFASPSSGTYYVMIRGYATYSGVSLVGNYTGGGGGGSCAHDKCTTGVALTSGCDSCVTAVCAADSFCCSSSWDSICVGEVTSVCGLSCP